MARASLAARGYLSVGMAAAACLLRKLQQLRPEVTAHMVLLPVQHRLAEELLDLLLGAVGSVGDGGTNRLERLVWDKVEDIHIGP